MLDKTTAGLEKVEKTLAELAEDLKDVSSRSKGNGDGIGTVAKFFFKGATKQGAHILGFGFLELDSYV